ncbi:MAG: ribosome maturation factor RimM [Pseudolabrys sp.]|nr:ribosome maturation factor RimM [Pseudolabrys sp.]
MADRIRVARIGAAHGLRGEVRIWSFTQDPTAIARYSPLETEDGARRLEIVALRRGKECLIARIRGVEDRDAAARLTNLDLFVPRERLPAIEEPDTFYQADLIGLQAVTTSGDAIGRVTAVHNFGGGDIIEIEPVSGGASFMLPFAAATVPTVDLAAKRIVVVPPVEQS